MFWENNPYNPKYFTMTTFNSGYGNTSVLLSVSECNV